MGNLSMQFSESLTQAYRPQNLQSFCGLDKQKKILSRLAANPRNCTLLFEGPSGTGKSSMAFCFSQLIGGETHHLGSQESNIENVKDVVKMCQYVPLRGGWHVVIMDEIDKCSPATQLYLLSKFDGTEPCPNTIFILTANDAEGRLEDRFLSRCIRLPKFTAYGAGESIRALLCRIWKERVGEDVPLPDMSRTPTSNCREAINWLELEILAA